MVWQQIKRTRRQRFQTFGLSQISDRNFSVFISYFYTVDKKTQQTSICPRWKKLRFLNNNLQLLFSTEGSHLEFALYLGF